LRQGAESEQTFELRNNPTTIGRSRESDIVLDDDAVSRAHAIVMRDEAGTYFIRDHNSGNGTFVNGERVTEFELEDGDEIQVGLVVMEFRLSEP
jgi:pSer/pThr/pTyr-binding forkhead associated (FHA) protein